MVRRSVRWGAVAMSLLAVSACGGGVSRTGASGSTPSSLPTSASSAAAATATPSTSSATTTSSTTEAAAPDGYAVESIVCGSDEYANVTEAWSASHEDCEATVSGSEPSALQLRALTTAYGTPPDPDDLSVLYGICAQSGRQAFSYIEDGASEEQAKEMAGAFMLCPTHPDRSRLTKAIASGLRDVRLEAAGRIFYDGTYRVGKDIKPGTYVVRDVEDCYWERTNSKGRPIENGFIPGAKRVEVTIRSSDYGFTAKGCGQWRPAN